MVYYSYAKVFDVNDSLCTVLLKLLLEASPRPRACLAFALRHLLSELKNWKYLKKKKSIYENGNSNNKRLTMLRFEKGDNEI